MDLAILFRAPLAYLPPFQSYESLKKLERSIHLRLLVRRKVSCHKLEEFGSSSHSNITHFVNTVCIVYMTI